jgi:hypothetical protein
MSTIAQLKNHLSHMLKQWGWFNFILFALNRLLFNLTNGSIRFYRYHVVAQPVQKASLLPSGRGKKIEIRLIGEQDEIIREFPRPAAKIRERFEHGAKCLVAFKEKQFIGFLWLLLDSYQEDEVRARYSPLPKGQAAWDFDVYVVPDSRLGLTFLRLWDEANRFLRENNILWSCSRISAFNTESLGAHARLGAIFLGSAIFFYVGRWQMTLASLSPYFHLSSSSSSFPEFRLDTQGLGEARPVPQKKPADK